MFSKHTSKTLLLAAGVAGAGIALAPIASADQPNPCETTGTTTVCETPGDVNIATTPPEGSATGGGNQNGSYGPSGDTPPVGDDS